MGHYQDSYDHDEEQNRKFKQRRNNQAKELFHQGLILAIPENQKQFEIKYKEMLFWLEND